MICPCLLAYDIAAVLGVVLLLLIGAGGTLPDVNESGARLAPDRVVIARVDLLT